jgi:hypothetical protein
VLSSAAVPATFASARPRATSRNTFLHVAATVALDECPRRALVHDHAGPQHDHVVAHALHFTHVMRREQHRAAGAPLVPLEVRAHPVADVGIERRRGLVEQQHVRLVQHRLRERHARALAGGEAAVGPLHEAGQIAVGDDRVDPLAGSTHAVEIGEHGEVLADR